MPHFFRFSDTDWIRQRCKRNLDTKHCSERLEHIFISGFWLDHDRFISWIIAEKQNCSFVVFERRLKSYSVIVCCVLRLELSLWWSLRLCQFPIVFEAIYWLYPLFVGFQPYKHINKAEQSLPDHIESSITSEDVWTLQAWWSMRFVGFFCQFPTNLSLLYEQHYDRIHCLFL